MTERYKPESYNSLSPYFVVEGADAFIRLLEEIFGAVPLRRYDHADGSILHAEVRIDDSVVMVGDAGPAHSPNTHLTHVYVPDVDALFARALAAGCTELAKPIRKEGDPDRRGSFRDRAGNVWAVATAISDQ